MKYPDLKSPYTIKLTPAEARNFTDACFELYESKNSDWWEALGFRMRDEMRERGIPEEFIMRLDHE